MPGGAGAPKIRPIPTGLAALPLYPIGVKSPDPDPVVSKIDIVCGDTLN